MKLAIYGDSYSDWRPYLNQAPSDVIDSCWARRIEDHYSVSNYSCAGASLFRTLEQFDATHRAHDRVLVIATAPGRWSGHVSIEGHRLELSSANQCDFYLDRYADSWKFERWRARQQILAVRAWYTTIQDHEFERYVHALQIRRIQTLRPDAIIIAMQAWPPTGFDSVDQISRRASCIDYIARAWRAWMNRDNIEFEDYLHLYRDYREHRVACHMTQEISDIFLKDVLAALDQGEWNPQLPQRIYHPHPVDYYYQPI